MQRWVYAAVITLALVAGVWRFHDLERDPDVVTAMSQESWGDPVYYLYNARSHVLFGDWRPDEGGAMYISPGYNFLASFWIRLFGPTLLKHGFAGCAFGICHDCRSDVDQLHHFLPLRRGGDRRVPCRFLHFLRSSACSQR